MVSFHEDYKQCGPNGIIVGGKTLEYTKMFFNNSNLITVINNTLLNCKNKHIDVNIDILLNSSYGVVYNSNCIVVDGLFYFLLEQILLNTTNLTINTCYNFTNINLI